MRWGRATAAGELAVKGLVLALHSARRGRRRFPPQMFLTLTNDQPRAGAVRCVTKQLYVDFFTMCYGILHPDEETTPGDLGESLRVSGSKLSAVFGGYTSTWHFLGDTLPSADPRHDRLPPL
jgi:hypothetical protein